MDDEAQSGILAIAITLHRLPDGLAVWSVVQPIRGARAAAIVLGALAAATIVGYVTGGPALSGATGHALLLVQAFVAGSVLHIILHRPQHTLEHDHHDDDAHDHAHPHPPSGIAAGIGALAGFAVLLLVTTSHPVVRRDTNELEAGTTFLALALDAAPAVLLAMLASGGVHAFIPSSAIERLGGGAQWWRAARGALIAPLVPTCSCGAVPFYRTLIRRGASITTAVAFLVSAPELGASALMISWALLGRSITFARIAAALVASICAGLVVGRIAPQASVVRSATMATAPHKLGAFREGIVDVIEHTGPWLVIGLGVAALVEPIARENLFGALSATAQVPLLAIASTPVYVCASGATPLVAIMMHKGLAPGAALAFLVAGPATNITTFGVLAKLHGRCAAAAYAAAVMLVAISAGLVTNSIVAPVEHAAFHDVGHQPRSRVDIACLVLVAASFVVVLVRRGPRHLLSAIIPVRTVVARGEPV